MYTAAGSNVCRREPTGVSSYLPRLPPSPDWEPLSCIPRGSGPVSGWGHDLGRGQWPFGPLGLWSQALPSLDRRRHYVLHCLYIQSLCHCFRQIYSHTRPFQVSVEFRFRASTFSTHNINLSSCLLDICLLEFVTISNNFWEKSVRSRIKNWLTCTSNLLLYFSLISQGS